MKYEGDLMYEINDGHEKRLQEYKIEYPETTILFENIGIYLDKNFNWKKQSALSQENKPKYRMTRKENISRRPLITVTPYKKYVQIKVAHNKQDDAMLIKMLPECFKKKTYKDGSGNDVQAFFFDVQSLEQLECMRDICIEDYFSPKFGKIFKQVVLNPTDSHDKEFVDETVLTAIKTRRGQRKFREKLLNFYNKSCIVTGCKVQDLLEAAHIIPHSENSNYSESNGLLLRSDIHTLYDLGYLAIDPNGFLHITGECIGSEYEIYNNKKVLSNISDNLRINLKNKFEIFTCSN